MILKKFTVIKSIENMSREINLLSKIQKKIRERLK